MFLRPITSWGQLLETATDPKDNPALSAERRTHIRHVSDMSTVCLLADAPDKESVSARVVNVSRGGVGLVADRPFERGTVLSVELPSDGPGAGASVLACVLRSSPLDDGQWGVGCIFVTELNDDDLRACRVDGEPESERRQEPRHPCFVNGRFRTMGTGELQWATARVANLSAHGAGLVAAVSVQVGNMVRLELANFWSEARQTTFARVVRLNALPSGEWFLACNFVQEFSEHDLRPLLAVPAIRGGGRGFNRVNQNLRALTTQQGVPGRTTPILGTSAETADLFRAYCRVR